MSAAPKDLESSLTKLTINPTPSKSSPAFRKSQKQPIADSWEDDNDDNSDSGSSTDRGPLTPSISAPYPNAPPPTPSSPSSHQSFISAFNPSTCYSSNNSAYDTPRSRDDERERDRDVSGKRPEKTDAVAKRMIAGALGVRAPKKTEEQRAYERVVKEKEIRKRKEEKEEAARREEERERAKAAVWED